MADTTKEQNPDTKDKKEQGKEQGADHIPQQKEEDKEEKKGSGGLLSSIGDPIGTFPPIFSIPLSASTSPLIHFHSNSSNYPLGNVLSKGLRPIGAPLEKGVTGPLGNALGGTTRGALGPLLGEKEERSELLGGDNKDSYESKPESLAGKEQTGQNPLGLDQTGRWGFREE
jgi:hypothetical protein